MKLSFYTRSFLVLSILSGAFFSRHVQAVEIPGDNINYSESELFIFYTPSEGANTSLKCFNSPSNDINKTLDKIGITSLDGISSVVSGDTNACFQKAGSYRLYFVLVDTAGNQVAYPGGNMPPKLSTPFPTPEEQVAFDAYENDPNNSYTITITPSVPVTEPNLGQDGVDLNGDGDYDDPGEISPIVPYRTTEVTAFENDPDGPGGDTPVTGGNCDIVADGVSHCKVEIIFRDAFGNQVTQLGSVNDVSVYLGISPTSAEGFIKVDGLFGALSSGTAITASNAFDTTNSKNTFLQEVFAGGTGVNGNTLEELLDDRILPNDGNQPEITDIEMVTPGHFRFMVRSHVPTVKLLNEIDPAAGAGVYEQPLSFDLAFPPIDANGALGATKQRWGGLVNGTFVFRPVASALPTISPEIVTYGTVLGSIETIVEKATNYLLYTPFSQYILQKRVDNGEGVIVTEEYSQPFTATGGSSPYTDVLTGPGDEGPVFETGALGIGSTLASAIGVGSQVQYTNNNGAVIRHISKPSGFTASDCTGYTGFAECYPFVPSGTARLIGADIEGAVQGERSKVNIYDIDDGTNSLGQSASYVGNVNNNAIRDDLLQQVERATKSPNTEAVVASSNTSPVLFSTIRSKFTDHDVVIVNGSVRMTNPNELPTGQKTLIIVDGNLFVEEVV